MLWNIDICVIVCHLKLWLVTSRQVMFCFSGAAVMLKAPEWDAWCWVKKTSESNQLLLFLSGEYYKDKEKDGSGFFFVALLCNCRPLLKPKYHIFFFCLSSFDPPASVGGFVVLLNKTVTSLCCSSSVLCFSCLFRFGRCHPPSSPQSWMLRCSQTISRVSFVYLLDIIVANCVYSCWHK